MHNDLNKKTNKFIKRKLWFITATVFIYSSSPALANPAVYGPFIDEPIADVASNEPGVDPRAAECANDSQSLGSTVTGAAWNRRQKLLMGMELEYQLLNAMDALETEKCMHQRYCTERNPILGRHPTTARLLAFKLGGGISHFMLYRRISNTHSRAKLAMATWIEIFSLATQGTVVALNFKSVF